MAAPVAYALIMTTCGSREEAERLAEGLVRGRLAACVQILPITSVYEWKGELNRDDEHLLFIKTRSARYADVEQYIVEHHSYDVPEVVQVPIDSGLPAYLKWVDESTRD